MAIQYRQLQGPMQVDTSIPDTGGAAAAASLSRAFKTFEGVVSDIGQANMASAGQQAGAAAGGSGNPGFISGWKSQTAYAKAYNNAALRSYAIQAEADAEDQAARLQVEANNDPQKFAQLYGTVRDQTLKNAPPEARAVLTDLYNQRLASGVAALSQAQAVEIKKEQLSTFSDGVTRGIDRVANLRAQNDPLSAQQADNEEMKLHILIDAAERDGTLDPVQARAIRQNATEGITKQTVVAQFEKVLESPNGDPVAFIRRLQEYNKTSEALPPDEEAKLVDSLMEALRQHNSLASLGESQMAAERKARFEAGNQTASSMFLDGSLTRRKLKEMVDNQDLDPNRATTLANELESNSGAKADDSKVLLQVETSLLDYTRDEVMTMRGLSNDTRRRLVLEWDQRSQGWEATQSARTAFQRIDDKLGIVPGTNMALLSDERKTQRASARRDLYDMVDALPPGERQQQVLGLADKVIQKYISTNSYEEAQKWQRIIDSANKEIEGRRLSPAEQVAHDAELKRYESNRDKALAESRKTVQ